MPAYIFDTGGDTDRWNALDTFTQAYIECAFWLGESSRNGDDCEINIPEMTFAELSDDALESIKKDCDAFRAISEVADALERAYDLGYAQGIYDDARAGHDFFLTRNHHGAGFWDRGIGEPGQILTKWAHTFGESNLYLGDDEKLYVA